MLINDKSVMKDILQAVAGTWDFTNEDNGWKVIEMRKVKIIQKDFNYWF